VLNEPEVVLNNALSPTSQRKIVSASSAVRTHGSFPIFSFTTPAVSAPNLPRLMTPSANSWVSVGSHAALPKRRVVAGRGPLPLKH
jgi:hypothetical protein